jgi:hypothetical protein
LGSVVVHPVRVNWPSVGGVGAALYNAFHSYPLPAALGIFGLLAGAPLAVGVASVWFAHIGMDRMAGYGLKYASGFKDTHLGRV